MALKTIVSAGRFCVALPSLVFSFYLVIIYSNGFWMAMVGSEYLVVASGLLISSVLAFFTSFPAFRSTTEKGKERGYLFYTAFLWLSYIFTGALIYMTRDSKKQQCSFWVNLFIASNNNTFFIDMFSRTYVSGGAEDYFIHQRTLEVHDFTVCVLIMSLVLYFVFIINYEEVLKRVPEQLLDPEFHLTPLIPANNTEFRTADEDDLHISAEDLQALDGDHADQPPAQDAADMAEGIGTVRGAVQAAQDGSAE